MDWTDTSWLWWMKKGVTSERGEWGGCCNLHMLIKLLFRSLALRVRALSAPPTRPHIHFLCLSVITSRPHHNPPSCYLSASFLPHFSPPLHYALRFSCFCIMSSEPVHKFPLTTASLPFCGFFYSFYFIFCLSAALPVRLIAPCRASLLRFTLFYQPSISSFTCFPPFSPISSLLYRQNVPSVAFPASNWTHLEAFHARLFISSVVAFTYLPVCPGF